MAALAAPGFPGVRLEDVRESRGSVQEQDRKLGWAAVLALWVIAAEAAWALFLHPPPKMPPDQQANHEAYYWIREAFTSSAFWTAAFTGLLTWSTWLLWRTTNDTLEHSRQDSARQGADMQASLAASRAANRIALQTSWAESRAYLVINSIFLMAYSMNAEVEIELTSMGKTPVTWIEMEGNAQVLPNRSIKASEVPINPTGPRRARWAVDPGRAGRRMPCPMEAVENSAELRRMVTQARQNGLNIVVQGTVRWGTVFGEILESTFFGWITPHNPQFRTNPEGGSEMIGEPIGTPSGVDTVTCRVVKPADDQGGAD